MNARVLVSQQASHAATSRNVAILCLWSISGIALSGLFFTAGLGADVTRALGAAD
jgi:hypothetical protein